MRGLGLERLVEPVLGEQMVLEPVEQMLELGLERLAVEERRVVEASVAEALEERRVSAGQVASDGLEPEGLVVRMVLAVELAEPEPLVEQMAPDELLAEEVA